MMSRQRAKYISGVFATEQYRHLVKFRGYATQNEFTVNLPDWRIFTVTVDGETASLLDNNISEHERRLEFDTGKLVRSFIFTTKHTPFKPQGSTRCGNKL